MLSFPTDSEFITRDGAFLSNLTSFSFFARLRHGALTGSHYAFMVRIGSSGDQLSFRRNTDTKYRASVTSGASVTSTSSTIPVVGTVYSVGMSWQGGIAAGLKVYVNGVKEHEDSTASQNTTFMPSGTGATLYIGCRAAGFEQIEGDMEMMLLLGDTLLAPEQFAQLHAGLWPHQCGISRTPNGAFYSFLGGGNNTPAAWDMWGVRNALGINGTPVFGGPLGYLVRPFRSKRRIPRSTAVAGGPANQWNVWPTQILHPNASIVLDNLTNGVTYDVRVRARDASGNYGPYSDISSATPTAPAPSLSTLVAPWQRRGVISKWRASQQ